MMTVPKIPERNRNPRKQVTHVYYDRKSGVSDEILDIIAPRNEAIDGIDGNPAIDRLLKELEL